jgi:hypothetical protein
MGQQQLLLLVLGIVIVGLAVVVGIQAFGENQKKANADAMTNDVIRIASDAQAWALKPTAFGGGNGQFNNADLTKIGYEATSSTYTNLNGDYTMTVTDGAGTAIGSVLIAGTNTARGNGVKARVCGTGAANITTVVGAPTVTAPAACP